LILVTGAAGKTGKAVLQRLLESGFTCRALVRTADHGSRLPRGDGLDLAIGDMRDPTAVGRAMEGATAVYHIPPNMHPGEVAMAEVLLEAAAREGVQLLVYHSVLHPQLPAMPHHWRKLQVETRVIESGLAFTILRPAAYMQNILGEWGAIEATGVYHVPYPTGTRLQLVDLEDVAEAAYSVLTQAGHKAASYELCGPTAPSQDQVAAEIARAIGTPVRAEQISLEAWQRSAEMAGMSSDRIRDFLAMFEHYGEHDFVGNPSALGRLLGRTPTSLTEFVDRVAISGR
jgi:NAD(P)H dehydrogenase (quinone)